MYYVSYIQPAVQCMLGFRSRSNYPVKETRIELYCCNSEERTNTDVEKAALRIGYRNSDIELSIQLNPRMIIQHSQFVKQPSMLVLDIFHGIDVISLKIPLSCLRRMRPRTFSIQR